MKHLLFLLKTIIISILVISSDNVLGKNLNGTYSDEYGLEYIEITGDTLIIKTAFYEVCSPGIPYDPIITDNAICKYDQISDSFLEINSIQQPFEEIFKNISIRYSKQTSNDSIHHPIVNFILPNLTEDVKLEIYDYHKFYSAVSRDRSCQIYIDQRRKYSDNKMEFSIAPVEYPQSNIECQYFGLLYYWYPRKIECKSDDIITIELPNLTDDLFKHYYIKGEYIQIKPNGLVWRGISYKKVK